ncbi:MAG: chitobiase/beta-hexosaminidase C-terminal domain-containing protein, partial [Bacteroidales bacterium]
PLFEQAKIKLANGNILNIIANNPDKNTYIAEVILNGTPIQSNYITHEQLMQGGTLEFRLCTEPSQTRGTDKKDYPYSLSNEPVASIPNIAKNLALFVDSIRFEITSATPDAIVYYTLDGTEPDEKSAIYESPVLLLNSKTVKAKAYKKGMKPSKTLSVNATKAVYKNSIQINPTQNGASYTYFEGYFQKTDDLNKAKAISSGTVKEINLDKKVIEDHFGFIFEAFIYVPQDAVYEFYTKSDDGSVLYIGEEKVVDNDLSHSAIIATGRIALKQGYHPVTLYYFEDYEGDHLSWGWRNPKTGRQETFPAEQLFVR